MGDLVLELDICIVSVILEVSCARGEMQEGEEALEVTSDRSEMF